MPIDTSEVAWVWGENVNPAAPAAPPTVSFGAWPYLYGKEWLRYDTGKQVYDNGTIYANNIPPDEIVSARVVFVNLFHTPDSRHIENVKRYYSDKFVVACPDPSLDKVMHHPEWLPMLEQMKIADMIAGRTMKDASVYGNLLNKPTTVLPCVIGTDEFFEKFVTEKKGNYILSLDHRFAPKATMHNVAALTEIQRKTGISVIYANAQPHTVEYAKLSGLKAEFRTDIPFAEFVELTAKARLCVDLYYSHAVGRQQILCGMLKTPIVASEWCDDAPGELVEPTNVDAAIKRAVRILTTEEDYERYDALSNHFIARKFGVWQSKQRLKSLLGEIEALQ